MTLDDTYPVVPYDFSLRNRCWFSGHGAVDSEESFPLLGPWYAATDGGSTSIETVDLTPVPAGARCTVSVYRGSSPVKGSSTTYTVG